MKRLFITIVIIVSAFGLGACSTSFASSPTEPVTIPTEPVASPTEPVASPTEPMTSPTESDRWLISAEGIGPYKLGAEYEPRVTDSTDQCSFNQIPESPGVVYLFDDANKLWPATDPAPKLYATMVLFTLSEDGTAQKPPATALGIGPGSTRQELLAAYPDAIISKPGGNYDSAIITLDSVKIVFDFNNPFGDPRNSTDVIKTVAVGVDRIPREYCA